MAAMSPPPPAGEAPPPLATDPLTDDLWEQIFAFLPVSSLVVVSAVCRRWASLIRSASFSSSIYRVTAHARRDQLDDLHFLLFADLDGGAPFVAAYRPSLDRWAALRLPCLGFRRVHASGGCLALAEQTNGSLVIRDLFARADRKIAPMISRQAPSYVLDLIDEGPSGYKIVAVTTVDRVFSQIFDSATRSWTLKGEFLGRFAVLGNTAYLDGILYCLSRAPDYLLAFDPVSGEWSLVDVEMPSPCVVCSHILVHRDSLFMVGGEEEGGEINKIVVWELDRGQKRWRVFGSMPDELFMEFRGSRMYHFYTVERRGVVCFCHSSSYVLLMCDLRGMHWWWPRKCPFPISSGKRSWFGHALEPQIGSIRW